MANSFTVGRAQLLFALCLPLAILLGYLLSDPLDPSNSLAAVLMVGALSIPLLMQGYHVALVFAWNAAITPMFIPGQPFLWVPLAFLGFAFALVNRFTNAEVRFVSVPSITKPLLFLLAVVIGTALINGGFGLRSFGSETYGGRNYVYILAAILGYFAFASQSIPIGKINLYVSVFFLTGITALVPNLAFMGGKSWYFLFYFFPPLYALEQAIGSSSLESEITRILGLSATSIALLCWVLVRNGLREVFNFRRPWPLFVFISSFGLCLYSGFRVVLLIFLATLGFQFVLEGLHRNKGLMAAIVCFFTVCGIFLVTSAEKLPLVAQRTLSVLPIRLSPVVEHSSLGSTEWRIAMWEELLPQVPKYFWRGKGFAIDSAELAFAEHNNRFGYGFEGAIASGDYHSGPLSLIIPLGIWGVIGFTWFIIASTKYLFRQYRDGDPALRTVNTFLLAYFMARLLVFIVIFGGFFSDLFIFTGIVGLSVSLNGKKVLQPEESRITSEAKRQELAYQGR